MPSNTWGYSSRSPYVSEREYFYRNQRVAGMAGQDGRVVLNPFTNLSPEETEAVRKNEAARIHMRENNFSPEFFVTPKQKSSLDGTPYSLPGNELQRRRSILARIISGDPSAGEITPRQQHLSNTLLKVLRQRGSR